ncbi:MAG: transcription antitermination factor NusB, partial [Calditrichota bacterium]
MPPPITHTSHASAKRKVKPASIPKRDKSQERSRRRPATSRETAVQLYAAWLKHPGNIETAAENALVQECWEPRDRAFFLELLFGVIRRHGYIEWLLGRLSPRRLNCGQRAYAATALGVYQLLYLDRTPVYAVVDSAVEIARQAEGPTVAGWTNAILHTLDKLREGNEIPIPHTRDQLFNLATLHSHPPWLVQRWSRFIDPENLEKFLEWNNRRPSVCLRVNSLKTTPDQALEELAAAKITAEPT